MTSEQSTRTIAFRISAFRPKDAVALYARLAVGAALLSAVASRFGLWDGTLDWAHYQKFVHFTAQVNSFLPAPVIPFLACSATIAETVIGTALIAGFQVRLAAFAAAILLALFGTAMAVSFGAESPLDYSVFSASAAALLLAMRAQEGTGDL
jgi:uncharacterized membrane protein YphA (DoxX/SURF4 family)